MKDADMQYPILVIGQLILLYNIYYIFPFMNIDTAPICLKLSWLSL